METGENERISIRIPKLESIKEASFRSSPHPVTVTTRIISFLAGNPNLNLHLPLESWGPGT